LGDKILGKGIKFLGKFLKGIKRGDIFLTKLMDKKCQKYNIKNHEEI